jgi:hypothetical protein
MPRGRINTRGYAEVAQRYCKCFGGVFARTMRTKARGEATEAIILARLLELGYSVSLPFGDNQRYDMIIDDGESLVRAQCKTGRLRNGAVIFNTASVNWSTRVTTSYQGQVDIFLVYCPDTKEVYRIPVAITGKRHFSLRIETARNGQSKNIRMASDFTL